MVARPAPLQTTLLTMLPGLVSFYVLVLLLTSPCHAALRVDPANALDLTPQTRTLTTLHNQVTAEQVWQEPGDSSLWQSLHAPFAIQDALRDYWFRIQLDQATLHRFAHPILALEHPYPQLDRVTLYWQDTTGKHHKALSGISVPRQQRQTPTRRIVFQVPEQLDPATPLLVRVESQAKQHIVFSMYEGATFANQTTHAETLWGIFFGVFLVTALLNAMIYIATREKVYLYYMGFVLASGITQASLSNHAGTWFWPDAGTWNQNSNLFFLGITGVFAILFARTFLNSHQHTPILHRCLTMALLPVGLISVLSLLIPFRLTLIMADLTVVIMACLIVITAFRIYRQGIQTARFFLAGWGWLMLSMAAYIMMMRDWIPLNTFTLYASHIGCVGEILFLAIALGDRIRHEQLEKRDIYMRQNQALDQLRDAQSLLRYRTLHDEQSGLPNRQSLDQGILRALQHCPENRRIYLSLIKLKTLREINNTLGHYVGDQVALDVAQQLQLQLGKLAEDARVDLSDGRQEYLAVIQGMTFAFVYFSPNDQTATSQLSHLLDALPKQTRLEGLSLEISTCAGLCGLSKNQCKPELLIRNAFVAIELAQRNDNNCQLYTEAVNPYSERRLNLISDLRQAITQNSLEVFLQPQLEIASQRIVSAEALLRWRHPTLGQIRPDEFIEIAENSGLITVLTRWVIEHAVKAIAHLHAQGYMLGISINVSAKNMLEPDLTDYIVDTLGKHHVNAEFVTFEITETAMLQNPGEIHYRLSQWNELGLATSIDDFGTGYSSLSHLKRYPMRELKIDRSFVKDMVTSDDDLMIVRSTLDISHNMRMRVVAEGVEDENMLGMLSEMGCDIIQGYFLTPPLSVPDFVVWLKNTPFKVGMATAGNVTPLRRQERKDA